MNQSDLLPHRTATVRSSPTGGARIAFVQSCWHKEIVDQCRVAFLSELARLGVAETSVDVFEVPGAFEIPLQAKLLAKSGRYVAIVAAGFVVVSALSGLAALAVSGLSGALFSEPSDAAPFSFSFAPASFLA